MALAPAAADPPGDAPCSPQVIADAADGEHGHLSHAEQRERRSLQLTARPPGIWRLTRLLDDVEARLAVLEQFGASRGAGVDAGRRWVSARADRVVGADRR
ncbi:MAG: hypothetical protein H6526_03005 [Actinobacteria bacterium]|nr:hypothetical protein [Actinomycetota bacterium]